MNGRTSVVLVDDHRILLDALADLVDAQPDLRTVGTAATVADAVAVVLEKGPDVVVLDLLMPDGGGLEVLRRLNEVRARPNVVVLTMSGEDHFVTEAIRLGASGYVPKHAVGAELLDAIRAVARGAPYLTPEAVRALLAQRSEPREPALSAREREVLVLTARGFSNAEIARRLAVSSKTVDTYRARIMDKLKLHRRSELIDYALRQGMLGAEGPLAS